MNQRTRSFPRRQHGVVAVYVAIGLTSLLAASFLAFEVGRVYMANRQLQKMANLAALDGVREVSACDRALNVTPAQVQQQLVDRVNDSLRRNGGTALFNQLTVTIDTGAKKIVSSNTGQNVRALTRLRTLPSGATQSIPVEDASTVRVTLEAPFPGLLTGFGTRSSQRMQVSATADQPILGTFYVGSGVASLNAGALNGVLSALLGGNVNLSLLDYQNGLARVNVTLEQLATGLGVSVADLSNPLALSTRTPVLSSALNGLATSLSGTASTTVVNLLRTLANQATNNNGISLDRLIGDLGTAAPGTPLINLLDLVTALAQAANADPSGLLAPIKLNYNPLIGGLPVYTYLKVIEPAQIGKGRPGEAEARTAQIRLQIRIDGNALLGSLTTAINNTINSALGLLSLIGLHTSITLAPDLRIGVDVNVAPAIATLDRIQCPKAGVNNGLPIATLSAQTGLVTIATGGYTGSAATAPPPLNTTSSLPLAIVDIDARNLCPLLGICLIRTNLGQATMTTGLSLTSIGVGQRSLATLPLDTTRFTRVAGTSSNVPTMFMAEGIPPASAVTGNPQTVSSSTGLSVNLGITQSPPTGSGLLGGLSGLVSSLVTVITSTVSTLTTVLNGLTSSLIDPLLGALGVRTGTANVVMESITIDRPELVSTLRPLEAPTP